MKILVTGGAGFIGTNFIRYWLRNHSKDQITVLDKLTYAGRRENLDGLNNVQFVRGDICDDRIVSKVMAGCDQVFHFAAESHVDRSIKNTGDFIKTNIVGTWTLLEAARKEKIDLFVHISTDEVYGSTYGTFTEGDPINPSSPYAATKASSDLLALSYHKTYGLPVIVTRSSNNYGPYQYPEKLIPLTILNALQDRPIPVYGNGKNVRDWLYVLDNCAGIETAAHDGQPGEIYNIAAGNEVTNLEIIKQILALLIKPESLISFVADRPGHDYRYALSSSKIQKKGWKPIMPFDYGLQSTVSWYCTHQEYGKPKVPA